MTNLIPELLRAKPNWLVWKLVQTPGEAKPRKIPYYANGKVRKTGSEDRAQLVTYEEAARVAHKWSGVGFAIFADTGVTAVDFDDCVDERGEVDPRILALVAGTYAEISPSGRGVRAFFAGTLPSRKDNDPKDSRAPEADWFAVEFFGTSGYVTVTCNATEETELFGYGAEPLTPAITALYAQRFGPIATSDDDTSWMRSVAPKLDLTPEDAREIVLALDPACGYQEWVGVAQALHHEFDGSQAAYDIFVEWSEKAEKPATRRVMEQKWRSFGNYSGPPRTMASLVRKQAAKHGPGVSDFWAYMPTHRYLNIHTRDTWPVESVNGFITHWPTDEATGKVMKPSAFLDKYRPVHQVTWWPGAAEVLEGMAVFEGGMVPRPNVRTFNLYRAPEPMQGDGTSVKPWLDHLRTIYPDDWREILLWLAHRVQFPGVKINHALVLGGSPGIGKDTLLEPVKRAVGPWNWSEVSPPQVLGRFNGWAKAVVVRVSEARDLGEVNRYQFYEATKTYIAAPPDVIRVDEKNLKEHCIVNVLGLIITTNRRGDGLYLPAEDRRHFVAWSERNKEEFAAGYWTRLYRWFDEGGAANVATYLRALDLSAFDPKAPPRKTPAFWVMVSAGEAPESGEMRDAIESLPYRDAFTLEDLVQVAMGSELAFELGDRKQRRALPHKLERVGYVPVRNPDAAEGQWSIGGKRKTIYSRADLPFAEQVRAARFRQSMEEVF